MLGALQAGWSVGYVVAALLSSYIFAALRLAAAVSCAVVPGIFTLLLLWKVPDPPSWTAARRPSAPRQSPSPMWRDPGTAADVHAVDPDVDCAPVRLLRRQYLAAELSGPATWASTSQNMGWYVAGTYTMMVLGKIITGYLADIFGRRAMWLVVRAADGGVSADPRLCRDAGQRRVSAARLRAALRRALRRPLDLHERKLSGRRSRHRGRHLLQPRTHRVDDLAAAHRPGGIALFDRTGHRHARDRRMRCAR